MSAFKTYDVRGIYKKDIDESLFFEIGKKIGFLDKSIKKIAVGKDGRLSSDSLCQALINGLISSGVDVIYLGRLSSPMLSYYVAKNKVYGAMITASHNPKEYNGVKFVDKNAIQISYEKGLSKIEKGLSKKSKKTSQPKFKKTGKIFMINILEEYKKNHLQKFSKTLFKNNCKKKLKVVFDFSNGVGSTPIDVLKKLNVKPIFINEIIDGNFPNHPCDQTNPKNLMQLQKAVKKNNADLGVIFDGDADRCAFVDEKANIARADLAFLILAEHELKNKSKIKNRKILYDLRFGKELKENILALNAKPVIMRVGNPFYKSALKKDKTAILAGEVSGHIMYNENFGIDDALYATLKLIETLSKSNKTFSQILQEKDKYYLTPELNFHIKNRDTAIKKVLSKFKSEKIIKLDGITVVSKTFWFNLRPSNTEPVVRLVIQANTKEIAEKIKKEIVNLIA